MLKRVWLVGNKGPGLFNVGSATLDEIWAFANEDGIVNGPMPTSSLDVSNSVIWNNKSVGVINHETKKLYLQNVTISGNGQTGLEQAGKVGASLNFVTITANGGPSGRGVEDQPGNSGVVTFAHSIVYGNSGGATAPQCQSSANPKPFSDGGYNVFADNSCAGGWPLSSTSGTKIDNPKLKALSRDDTKPNITLTHALEWGSAAIDLVPKSECISRDQRNVTRPIDGNGDSGLECDAGAYEFQP